MLRRLSQYGEVFLSTNFHEPANPNEQTVHDRINLTVSSKGLENSVTNEDWTLQDSAWIKTQGTLQA